MTEGCRVDEECQWHLSRAGFWARCRCCRSTRRIRFGLRVRKWEVEIPILILAAISIGRRLGASGGQIALLLLGPAAVEYSKPATSSRLHAGLSMQTAKLLDQR